MEATIAADAVAVIDRMVTDAFSVAAAAAVVVAGNVDVAAAKAWVT